jgi:hypothetical protein
VVNLIRIKVLGGAGVPLVRVHQLLDATPDEFAEALHTAGPLFRSPDV